MSRELKPGLHLEQKQQLALTPALKQALEVLAMPALELEAFVREQLTENPVLELAEEPPEPEAAPAQTRPGLHELSYEDDWPTAPRGRAADYTTSWTDTATGPLVAAPQEEQLSSYLRLQLSHQQAAAAVKQAAEFLIGYLDDDGYLALPLDQAAAAGALRLELAEEALRLLQSLEPAGVAARDLAECLRLQVGPEEPQRALLLAIIDRHLPDLARNRVAETARLLGQKHEAVEYAFAAIRSLQPRPAAAFAAGVATVPYIVPDIIVRKLGDEYQVSLNRQLQPQLAVNLYYRELGRQLQEDREADAYLRQKLQAAENLIRNIEKRHQTVSHLAQLVMRHQRGFLEQGLPGLQPLTMRQLAEEAEVHESTVSRAVAGKYVQTPRGVYAWKFFFPRAYEQEGGILVPAWVKAQLLQLIQNEDKRSPYSDNRLQELLAAQGIKIARRTVAKYREELQIPARAARQRGL